MTTRDPIRIAVRAYTERQDASGGSGPPLQSRWPNTVLVFDTETTTDPTQQLQFGAWQFCEWTPEGLLRVLDEGLFHADELPERDPEGFGMLQDVAEARGLSLTSRHRWVDRIYYRAACGARSLVCGFNLPFDLTRIAVHVGEARKSYRGGFSLALFRYFDKEDGAWKEDPHKPRVRFKTIDSKWALMGFASPAKGVYVPGRFLDLRTLAFALTNKALTNKSYALARACEAFGVEAGKADPGEHGEITDDYIDYARQDVRATAGLLEALRADYDPHPIGKAPDQIYSPASVAKGYLDAMGVTPPRNKFDVAPETLGKTMVAYYGGRAECRIRRTEVPVVYTDFLSMYPTVNALLGIWPILVAERLELEDATEEVRELLDGLSADHVFDPDLWSRLSFFAQVRAGGDILPVRGEYDPHSRNHNIGVNPLTSEEPLWYAGPDLVASALLTGEAPEVVDAFRITPEGIQDGLKPISLGGIVEIDPTEEDFFRRVIELRKDPPEGLSPEEEERLETFLKVLANSGAYGIYAEMNPGREPDSNPGTVDVYGLSEPFEHESTRPEGPGTYCFPPVAAFTTAGARLMLAGLESEVHKRGGSYAFCDTDSMAVVASREGGLVVCPGGAHETEDGRKAVRAVSWEEVDAIVQKFERLNPYDPEAVSQSVLEVEGENFRPDGERRQLWAYVISAKRYVLFTEDDAGLEVVKASEHGLGHLLNPIDPEATSTAWIEELWRWIVRLHRGDEVELPAWMDQPAVSRLTVSSPHLWAPFDDINDHKPYRDQIKPMNFLLSVPTKGLGHLPDTDPERFHLVAPYTADPDAWSTMRWLERYSGERVAVTTSVYPSTVRAQVKSYRDVFQPYRTHPEPTTCGPERSVCDRQTVGLLHRRHVTPLWIEHVGKESNRLEEVEKGAVRSLTEVRETYRAPGRRFWDEVVVPWMKTTSARELAEMTGLSERQVRDLKNRKGQPSGRTLRTTRHIVKPCGG